MEGIESRDEQGFFHGHGFESGFEFRGCAVSVAEENDVASLLASELIIFLRYCTIAALPKGPRRDPFSEFCCSKALTCG